VGSPVRFLFANRPEALEKLEDEMKSETKKDIEIHRVSTQDLLKALLDSKIKILKVKASK